jgi:serine/threonine protein kinase
MELASQSKIKRCQTCGLDYELNFAGQCCPEDGGQLYLADGDPIIGIEIAERYKVISRIGSGGFSVVYLAFDNRLKRQVAIKLLHAFLQESEELMKRFRRETELTARLQHPNLAVIYDSGALSNGQPYIAMEYLQGVTLEEVIASEKRLPVARTVKIVAQICDALNYAHKAGVIHRDLTPRNIFVLQDDSIKIIDFGLAFCFDGSRSLTSPGDIIGTPQFMSPEQCRGEPIDRRADIYSIGLIMQYMLSGVKPIDGDNVFQVVAKQVNETPTPLAEVCPDLFFPSAVRQAIQGCIAKDPNARFSDCAELKQMIESARTGNVTINRLPSQSSLPGASSGQGGSAGATSASKVWGVIGIAVAATVALVGAVFFIRAPLAGAGGSLVPHTVPTTGSTTATAVVSIAGAGASQQSAVKPADNASVAKPQPTTNEKNATKTNLPASHSTAVTATPQDKAGATQSPPAKANSVASVPPHTDPIALPAVPPKSPKTAGPAAVKPIVHPAPSDHPKKPSQTSHTIDAQAESDAKERASELRQNAKKAFDSDNYDVALMLYRDEDRDLYIQGYKDLPNTIHCKVKILQCLKMLHRDQELEPALSGLLAVMKPKLQHSVAIVTKMQNGCWVWNMLATDSYDIALGKGLTATRADYLDWARGFFALSYKQWDRPKDDAYRRMIGRYCMTLRLSGHIDESRKLEQTEHPIFEAAPQPAAPPKPQPQTAPPHHQAPPPKGRPHKTYVRNYHF